ncbi:MAG: cysteine desulfurase [Oscillospiraceae bacterium]|nr:cysteine desulfurase [Oscillospiraceae bacterium]
MPIYLDNAATTKPAPAVIEAITEALSRHYGNPSSLHRMGLEAQLMVDDARKTIAGALGTEKDCILFTSGATESSNLALRSAAAVYGRRKKHIITSAVEHASVRSTIDALEQQGYTVTRVKPDENGVFQAKDFLDAVTPDTFLVSVMLAENETGRILPVQKLFRMLQKKYPDIIRHCDVVQAFMKLPVSVSDLPADLLSMSAHKIHGPKGCGALYIRKGIRMQSIVTGGKQEKGIRPGTEASPLIAGFGAAVKLMQPTIAERYAYVSELRALLLEKLGELPYITLNSDPEGSPYIVNFSVKGIRSEIMLHFLEDEGIYVSSGSACSKGVQSGVLGAYNIPDAQADCALRVSFSEETTAAEIDALIAAIEKGQATLIHKK